MAASAALLVASMVGSAATKYSTLMSGENFVHAAAVHVDSGDILFVANPEFGSTTKLSLGLLPKGGGSVKALDSEKVLSSPIDLAISGDTAYVVDQGKDGIAAFTRSAAGAWSFSKRWDLADLVPDCDEKRRSYGMVESVAIGAQGEVYVAMAMVQHQGSLLHPFTKCAAKNWTGAAVRRLDPDTGKLSAVFDSTDFFLKWGPYPGAPVFHIRALATTAAGDVLVAGYGDDMDYFGHSVWLWPKAGGDIKLFAGQQYGEEGHSGDGSKATNATLDLPFGVEVACGGKTYIVNSGTSSIRVVDKDGIISSLPKLPGPDGLVIRKLHRGPSDCSMLLGIEGLGENSGSVVRIDLEESAEQQAVVI